MKRLSLRQEEIIELPELRQPNQLPELSSQFGQATPMMNNYLGSGGDNPMYQIGVRVRSN